ncbi:hypothetical protein L1987_08425 [Smallanthus sonchifolius]|uniref:Uncharacterized protein n=1 Tax=Smallanthus sonchifolius TaxID=185202 RepID=A0ACB9JKP1_9ASTR|nr:hypothetical protein L1987_08425 [Smallanthus sonchifolius]
MNSPVLSIRPLLLNREQSSRVVCLPSSAVLCPFGRSSVELIYKSMGHTHDEQETGEVQDVGEDLRKNKICGNFSRPELCATSFNSADMDAPSYSIGFTQDEPKAETHIRTKERVVESCWFEEVVCHQSSRFCWILNERIYYVFCVGYLMNGFIMCFVLTCICLVKMVGWGKLFRTECFDPLLRIF